MNRTPAGSHRTRHLDCLQLSSAWKCWLPSQSFPLSAALQRVFITSASSEAVTPMYLSHGVLEIAMTLSNAPECQAQFRKLDGTSLYHPSAPFPCCSLPLSLLLHPGRPWLRLYVALHPLPLALLLSYCVITSSPVSSSKSAFTFLWNGDIICLFC